VNSDVNEAEKTHHLGHWNREGGDGVIRNCSAGEVGPPRVSVTQGGADPPIPAKGKSRVRNISKKKKIQEREGGVLGSITRNTTCCRDPKKGNQALHKVLSRKCQKRKKEKRKNTGGSDEPRGAFVCGGYSETDEKGQFG